jgi:hypothetical protein
MIAVIVRDDQVVDLLALRHLSDGFHDPVGIAAARIAAIDQDRFARGRDNQRRRAPLDIDPIDVQPVVGGAGLRMDRQEQREGDCQRRKAEGVHGVAPKRSCRVMCALMHRRQTLFSQPDIATQSL